MLKIIRRVLDLLRQLLDQILGYSKKIVLPGFGGVALYDIIDLIYQEMLRDNITTRANSVAFSIFIAMFPFLIFLFTLIPFIQLPIDYFQTISDYIHGALPHEAADYIMNIIKGLVEIERGGLQSFSILLSIFFASSGVLTLMYGFDKSTHEAFKERSYLQMRWVAFWLTIVMTLLFVSSFVLLVLGNTILTYISGILDLNDGLIPIIAIGKWLVGIFLVYTGVSIIYRYGPSYKKKIRFYNTGGLLATLMAVIISVGFSYFVDNFGRYNEIYGSIGALIVLLLWIQFVAFAILIGFELNASIVVNRYENKYRKNVGKY